jgi:MFS family permease
MPETRTIADTLYEALTNEEDARVCADISDSACRETPRNFALLLASYCFTKLGDAIASPKTTLAWLTSVVGAPAFVLGLLVPVRESGSMIPQLFIGSVIRRLAVRKWVFVAGCIGQCLCVAGIGLVALTLTGMVAGLAILALVALFSLSRGLCSVASKDVLGKTIPKPKRGQLTGWSASVAGLVSVGVGIALMLPFAGELGARFLGYLLVAAGLLWLAAAGTYTFIKEYPGETGGGRNALEALTSLRLLQSDPAFRRFVATRALLMCSALSAPFYVALAQQKLGSPSYLLGAFVAAAGVASLVSAPVWGRFADASSKRAMIAAALVTSGIGIATFLVDRYLPGLAGTVWYLPFAYFVLSVAHSGVRVGRKTYVVNLGGGNKRTDYVAISNSVIGVLLLLVGSVGTLTPLIGNGGVIGLLALMGFAGAWLGSTLPVVEDS